MSKGLTWYNPGFISSILRALTLPPPVSACPPPTPTPPSLLDRVRRSCRRRQYSDHTEKAYVQWVVRYVRFHDTTHPPRLGADDMRAFLTHLAADRNVAAATQSQTLNALTFLYDRVLGTPSACPPSSRETRCATSSAPSRPATIGSSLTSCTEVASASASKTSTSTPATRSTAPRRPRRRRTPPSPSPSPLLARFVPYGINSYRLTQAALPNRPAYTPDPPSTAGGPAGSRWRPGAWCRARWPRARRSS